MSEQASIQKSLVLESSTSAVRDACEMLVSETKAIGFGQDDLFGIRLSLEEACINAVKHGNCEQPDKKVAIDITITPEKFDITITDAGPGFGPDTLPDPKSPENLCQPCGRGVLLMKEYMDLVEFNEKGNSVHMIKCKSKS